MSDETGHPVGAWRKPLWSTLGTVEDPRWACLVPAAVREGNEHCCMAGHLLPEDAIDCALAKYRAVLRDELAWGWPGGWGEDALRITRERLAPSSAQESLV